MLLLSIYLVFCASSPSFVMVYVKLPHVEQTTTEYFDVVASALPTTLKVSNRDVTIFVYFNTPSVFTAKCIEFSVVFCAP